jgi:hypothetical protein
VLNFLRILGDIEELRQASDLLVFHVVKTPLDNLVNEVEDAGQILLSQMCCLLLEGERLVRPDTDLSLLAFIRSSKDCLFTIMDAT